MGNSSMLSRDHSRFARALDDCLHEAESIRRYRVVDRDKVMAILTVFFGPVGEAHVERERVLRHVTCRRIASALWA